MAIRGEFLDKTEDQLNSFRDQEDPNWIDNYDPSESFRRQCVKEGFHLVHLYPVYHQGWECDEWGAIGTKDGKRFRLETNHGSLYPQEVEPVFPILKTIKTLFFGDDDAD